MDLVSVDGVIYDIRFTSVIRLRYILVHTENQIADGPFMRSFPDQGKHIYDRQDRIIQELHRRKFDLCLEEMITLFEFQHTKKDYVIRWLDQIDIKNIVPMKDIQAQEMKKMRR